MKFDGNLRKSQLIVPFGPGAIYTLTDGVNCIISGLDDWFKEWCPKKKDFADTQLPHATLLERGVIIEDDRLSEHLRIGHIYSVPSKEFELSVDEDWKRKLRIPFYIFPSWWYCRNCGHMVYSNAGPPKKCNHTIPSTTPNKEDKPCSSYGYVQVPFALACEKGHLSEFPWVEWLHLTAQKEHQQKCRESLIYKIKDGGNALDSIVISCENCHCTSSLKGIMTNNPVLQNFSCEGAKVWLPQSEKTSCPAQPKAIMTNAGNAYYADVKSSLYIQPQTKKLADIVHKINSIPQEQLTKHKDFLADDPCHFLKYLGGKNSVSFDESSTDITEAYTLWQASLNPQKRSSTEWSNNIKKDEWDTLIRQRNNEELVIRQQNLPSGFTEKYGINQLSAIDKVRETRVLAGFSRISSSSLSQQGNQELLWSNIPANIKERWLPGVKIYGEGIFFTFDEAKLQEWENQDAVIHQINKIQTHHDSIRARQQEQGKQPWAEKEISPRFVLLHTLSHLIIKQLAFYCGYNIASMRERLYSDNNQDSPMAGILIYTASGDSEGTLGGLASMSNPDSFRMIIENALDEAFWCSSDPVCSEQEPSLTGRFNLAACHSCCLLPETSCEEFNSYLDRALWVPLNSYSFLSPKN